MGLFYLLKLLTSVTISIIIPAMIKLPALLLIFAFLSVGIVGISMMGPHNECLFGKIGTCASDVLAMINAHFGAFETLSAAVFGRLIVIVAMLISLLAVALGVFLINIDINFSLAKKRFLLMQNSTQYSKETLCHWLSLHENSPSFSLARI